MKIIFFGSTDFSCRVLEKLLELGQEVFLIITQPPHPGGRGLKEQPTEIKRFASSKRLKVFEPEDLRSPVVLDRLKKAGADLFVAAAYGKILPEEVLSLPKNFVLGIHPSLLPKYRGAAPINWALINGEKETGVSFFKVDGRMDAGDIVFRKKIKISREEDFISLQEKLIKAACQYLPQVLKAIEQGRVEYKVQRESSATFAPKIKKDTGRIDWHKPAQEIYNLARGLVPYPCAYFMLGSKKVKVWKSSLAGSLAEENKAVPGTVKKVSKKDIEVFCGRGSLNIEKLQVESKNIITAQSFINGYRIKQGDKFE